MASFDDSVAAGIRAKLDEVEWGVIIPKLTACAHRCLRYRSPERAEEIAMEAIALVYDVKKLRWDPSRHPDVFVVLGGLVKGLAMNERRRKSATREVGTEPEEMEEFLDGGASPEERLAREEEKRVGFGLIKAKVANDAKAIVVVDLFQLEVVETAEQAERAKAFKLTHADICKARRRVFRAMEAVEREREGEGGPPRGPDDQPSQPEVA